MSMIESGGNHDRADEQSPGWERELDDLLERLNVGREIAEPTGDASARQPAAPAEAAANSGETADWSAGISVMYRERYGIAMHYPVVQEVRSVNEHGREVVERKMGLKMVGFILPMDHTPSGVVALYKNGAHDYLPAPPDPEGEQEFRARFIPGGAPFVLKPDGYLDDPRQLFLMQATYDHEGLRQFDNHDHGDDASVALTAAVRAAPRLAQERHAAKVRNIAQGTLALEGISSPEEPKQQ